MIGIDIRGKNENCDCCGSFEYCSVLSGEQGEFLTICDDCAKTASRMLSQFDESNDDDGEGA